MKTKLAKIQQMTVEELRVRGSQAFAALAERHGWSSRTKLPTDEMLFRLLNSTKIQTAAFDSADNLLAHFRSRTKPAFFGSFADRANTVAEFQRRWPAAGAEVIKEAEQISAGRFDLLGLRDLSFGVPIDWHLEPIAGRRAPVLHWSKLDYLDSDLAGDKKIIWELNRHQYFVRLGQAYWLSGDERYAQTFVQHVVSWMDENPPKLGINWASSLEVSFRSISWIWALHFFRDSPSLTPSLFLRILKFLYLNARHLETFLSTYFSPNTHLTGEALGLFYLGTLLAEFKEAGRWRDTGLGILISQLSKHVRSDGVYFEQSSYYHRYTTDFYIHLLLLFRANGGDAPAQLKERLKLSLDHLMYITRPDGTTPLFGDDDGGRLIRLEREPAHDFRSTLATGAALFGRPDYKYVADGATGQEILWLLGAKGLEAFDSIEAEEPARESVAFAAGGYYVMRDGWTRTSNYLLFDSGPHGSDNCGHAHADALSFELAAGGVTLLVDPGTYTYTGSKEMRDWFRGSSAHNTLTIDGESSSVPAGPFSWKTTARSGPTTWIGEKRFDYVAGSHSGYKRLSTTATHSRSILFLKNDYWILRDRVPVQGDHLIDLWFHFDSRVSPLRANHEHIQVVSETDGTAGLQLAIFANGGGPIWEESWVSRGSSRWENGWVSHCYGEKEVAPVYVFSEVANGSQELVTFLLPQITGHFPKPRVREIEAIGGRAFEIASENSQDVLLIRDSTSGEEEPRVATTLIASDFEWTWARFSSDRVEVPDELVLIGGHNLEVCGKVVLMSPERISHIAGFSVGDQFRWETGERTVEMGLPAIDFSAVFPNQAENN